MARNQLIFISGGVRSGKSSFAELYASQLAERRNSPLYYLATSISFDKEMEKRIEHHQHTRNKSRHHWQTIEAASNLSQAMKKEHVGSVMLLDCLTVWLNNEFYEEKITEDTCVNSVKWHQVKNYMIDEIKRINQHVDTLIIVSNDIFHEGINQTNYVNIYSQMLGELHQLIVKEAFQAYTVESSVPVLMKQS
ncbi:MAG TPA: bifunctional adenosylcobinamide kinase/adenosylcobinamide-phosphate guanylyltransferase [Pseudogracilibacillus sp.]|nr:bifunctional adenosylcobinamide kinase/adenosylcobinamide-phosphate guanylyltransferase [Pseudogracilibacillus sp.]